MAINAMSNYLEEKVLNAVLRGQAFPSIPKVYAALFTTNPGEDGSTGTEVSGGGYSRKEVTFAAPTQVLDIATCTNSLEVDFGVATTNWGYITHSALYDASTGGNMLYHGALETPKTIETADSLRYAVGKLKVTQS